MSTLTLFGVKVKPASETLVHLTRAFEALRASASLPADIERFKEASTPWVKDRASKIAIEEMVDSIEAINVTAIKLGSVNGGTPVLMSCKRAVINATKSEVLYRHKSK